MQGLLNFLAGKERRPREPKKFESSLVWAKGIHRPTCRVETQARDIEDQGPGPNMGELYP